MEVSMVGHYESFYFGGVRCRPGSPDPIVVEALGLPVVAVDVEAQISALLSTESVPTRDPQGSDSLTWPDRAENKKYAASSKAPKSRILIHLCSVRASTNEVGEKILPKICGHGGAAV